MLLRRAHRSVESAGQVLADCRESSAKIDYLLPVEMKRHNCGAACRSEADDYERVTAPLKMFRPGLTAGIEERNEFSGSRIRSLGFCIFMTVAGCAGPGQL